MKKFSKILSVALLVALVLSLGITSAFADETSQHTITISNTDQNVSHTYEAYQVFKGKLDDTQTKLSDIQWGNGVDGTGVLEGLITANNAASGPLSGKLNSLTLGDANADPVVPASTAAEVAVALSNFSSTNGDTATAGEIDAVAAIIAENLATKAANFSETSTGSGTYTATVTGDGYYFIKDTTATLKSDDGSDTLSKYLLAVIKNAQITAKDTHLTPEKEIVAGSERVKEGTAAVGDTVTFEVKIPVPDTRKYVDHFIFDMVDTLPKGLTFTGITSVVVNNVAEGKESAVPYTLTVNGAGFTTPADPVDADAPVGNDGKPAGQTVKLVFTNFKENAETNGWIGNTMVVTYTTIVNKNADFTPTGNINEVKFDYSNNPNHDYNGDQPGPDEPMGETPKDRTKTLLINLVIKKTGDQGQIAALAGAEFEITSEDYNVTLVTGEKYEASSEANPYTAKAGETIETGTYYKLKDGSYTTTAPTTATASSYDGEATYVKVSYSKSVVTPGTTKKITAITDKNGQIKLEGLKPGTYTVKETKAPTGYNLDSTPYTIKINWTYNSTSKTGTLSRDETSSQNFVWDDEGTTATASITIDNNSGTQLPSTGGIGTTIFYVVGGILVVAAGVLLITKKRMSE